MSQICNTHVFKAARAPTRFLFDAEMDDVKVNKRASFDHLLKTNPSLWTHHASAQDTTVLDQVTSKLAKSTMNMVSASVSKISRMLNWDIILILKRQTARRGGILSLLFVGRAYCSGR